jgi:hypothetical protein
MNSIDHLTKGKSCPLTGWKIVSIEQHGYNYQYKIQCFRFSFEISVGVECFTNSELLQKKHIIRWLLLKNRFSAKRNGEEFPSQLLHWQPLYLLDIIEESYIPESPKEKFDQFLLDLLNIFPDYEGEIGYDQLLLCSFFKSSKELDLFLNGFHEKSYLEFSKQGFINALIQQNATIDKYRVKIKFEGLNYIALLQGQGRSSKNCFIAMSFSGTDYSLQIRDAIKNAVSTTGYNPILINESKIESDKTINDAIIAEIKRAKFVIADFTEQKRGVYFEAGYALGRGLNLIYSCDEEDFKNNSHFDVNHYPHILYKNANDLEKQLIDKIRAWIE